MANTQVKVYLCKQKPYIACFDNTPPSSATQCTCNIIGKMLNRFSIHCNGSNNYDGVLTGVPQLPLGNRHNNASFFSYPRQSIDNDLDAMYFSPF